eukprot:TRINITY_DN3289_c0_g1_i2.p1 TRINITY_DN3289_c0_g1~~TRINITY_DN3289_c0_g1_i2.p1  ORF type:complete len:734 (+),score=128.54 TRINITY_DN3289_c0_g1_i2:232-2202(+)
MTITDSVAHESFFWNFESITKINFTNCTTNRAGILFLQHTGFVDDITVSMGAMGNVIYVGSASSVTASKVSVQGINTNETILCKGRCNLTDFSVQDVISASDLFLCGTTGEMNISSTLVARVNVETDKHVFSGARILKNIVAADCKNGDSIFITSNDIDKQHEYTDITVLGGEMKRLFDIWANDNLIAADFLVKSFIATSELIQADKSAILHLDRITLYNVTNTAEMLVNYNDPDACSLSNFVSIATSLNSINQLNNASGAFGNNKMCTVNKTLYVYDTNKCAREDYCESAAECQQERCACGGIPNEKRLDNLHCGHDYIVSYGDLNLSDDSIRSTLNIPPMAKLIVTGNVLGNENSLINFQHPVAEPAVFAYADIALSGKIKIVLSGSRLENGEAVIPLMDFGGVANNNNVTYQFAVKGRFQCFTVQDRISPVPFPNSGNIVSLEFVQTGEDLIADLPVGVSGTCQGNQTVVIGDDNGDVSLEEDLEVPDGVVLQVDGDFSFGNPNGRLVYPISPTLGTGRLTLASCNASSEGGALTLDLSQTTITQATEITLVEFSSESCRTLFEEATISLTGEGGLCVEAEPTAGPTGYSVLLTPSSSAPGCKEGDDGDDATGMIIGIMAGVVVLLFAVVVIFIIITVAVFLFLREKGSHTEF